MHQHQQLLTEGEDGRCGVSGGAGDGPAGRGPAEEGEEVRVAHFKLEAGELLVLATRVTEPNFRVVTKPKRNARNRLSRVLNSYVRTKLKPVIRLSFPRSPSPR